MSANDDLPSEELSAKFGLELFLTANVNSDCLNNILKFALSHLTAVTNPTMPTMKHCYVTNRTVASTQPQLQAQHSYKANILLYFSLLLRV